MKKITLLALTLVLTALLFAGCRTTDGAMDSTGGTLIPTETKSTTVPTTEATVPSTEAPTEVTTTPTDGMIDPTESMGENGTDGNPATGDVGGARSFGGR